MHLMQLSKWRQIFFLSRAQLTYESELPYCKKKEGERCSKKDSVVQGGVFVPM